MRFYLMLTVAVTAFGIALRLIVKNVKTSRLIFCLVTFAILGSLSAFRYDVGYDYNYIYVPLYEPILFDPFVSSAGLVHEPGFVLLERLIALCSSDFQMLFIVTGYLTIGLFMLYYYLYSPDLVTSVFMFLSLGQFYCSMNFIRQTLAGAICLFAIPFLQCRKFWRYCSIALLASLFHTSALILLPFYFINLLPVTGIMLLIYIPVSIVFYLSSSGVLELVTQFIYGHYNAGSPEVALGFPLTGLAILVFLFLYLFANRKMMEKRNKTNYVYLNYAFFSLLFMFLGTKHSILNRFAIFFELAVPFGFAAIMAEWRKDYPSLRELIKNVKANVSGIRRTAAVYASCVIAAVGGGMAINGYILGRDSHGVVPYQLIYHQPFYTNASIPDESAEPLEEDSPNDEPVASTEDSK